MSFLKPRNQQLLTTSSDGYKARHYPCSHKNRRTLWQYRIYPDINKSHFVINLAMKPFLFTIALILLAWTCKSQTDDTIPTELVHIRASGGTQYLTLNKDASLIKSKFGAPSSITSEYWEMDDITVQKLDYRGNIFYLHNKQLVAFELNTADFYVGTSDRAIRVGDQVSTLSEWFPASYKGRDHEFMSIQVSFSSTDPMARAEYLAVQYDEKGKITKVDLVME